jgi:hypothetical protein
MTDDHIYIEAAYEYAGEFYRPARYDDIGCHDAGEWHRTCSAAVREARELWPYLAEHNAIPLIEVRRIGKFTTERLSR